MAVNDRREVDGKERDERVKTETGRGKQAIGHSCKGRIKMAVKDRMKEQRRRGMGE